MLSVSSRAGPGGSWDERLGANLHTRELDGDHAVVGSVPTKAMWRCPRSRAANYRSDPGVHLVTCTVWQARLHHSLFACSARARFFTESIAYPEPRPMRSSPRTSQATVKLTDFGHAASCARSTQATHGYTRDVAPRRYAASKLLIEAHTANQAAYPLALARAIRCPRHHPLCTCLRT